MQTNANGDLVATRIEGWESYMNGGAPTATGTGGADHPLVGATGVQVPNLATPGATTPPAQGTSGPSRFGATAPTYTPGDITMEDLEGFDFETLLAQFGGNEEMSLPQVDETYAAGTIDTTPLLLYWRHRTWRGADGVGHRGLDSGHPGES